MIKRVASLLVVVALPWWVPIPAWASDEDSPSWSCVDDGNRICGPNNSEGKPAACYDDGGVIVATWPCHVEINADGSSDVWKD